MVEKSSQLCWTCLNAVPNAEAGRGCEWSTKFEPVPGWEAEEQQMRAIYRGGPRVTTYRVRGCPKYRQEPERKVRGY